LAAGLFGEKFQMPQKNGTVASNRPSGPWGWKGPAVFGDLRRVAHGHRGGGELLDPADDVHRHGGISRSKERLALFSLFSLLLQEINSERHLLCRINPGLSPVQEANEPRDDR
jgi:hypothetical protein